MNDLLDPGPDPHPYGDVLGALETLERRQRGADAVRVMLIAAALDQVVRAAGTGAVREIAYRSLRAELAAAFGQSEHLVEQQMSLAHSLTREYGAVYEALELGEVAYAHARVIVDAGAVIGVGDAPEVTRRRAGYEREVLEVAVRETPNRLRPIARRLAEAWAEHTIEERHREACTRRRVTLVDLDDGMADLTAHLPAVEAHAAYDRITRIAKACERGERVVRDLAASTQTEDQGDEDTAAADGTAAEGDAAAQGTETTARTRDQLRADTFTDLLLASDENRLFAGDAAESIRARVQIVVPVDVVTPPSEGSTCTASSGGSSRRSGGGSACGSGGGSACGSTGGSAVSSACRSAAESAAESIDQSICDLAGYGPIDAGTAQRLAGGAPGWNRILLDRASGSVLSVDRYRPSEGQHRMLEARDKHCRFPGCRVPVSRCDLDHTIDAALGGPTSTENLAALCRGHHVLKHHSDWSVVQEPGGVLRWTSPAGRDYVDRPHGMARPSRPARSREPARSSKPARSPVLRSVRAVRFEPDNGPEVVF